MKKKTNTEVSLDNIMAIVQACEESKVVSPQFSVPLTSLMLNDVFGGGIHSGGRYYLGGPTGTGKTTTALMIALDWAKAGHSVIYIDTEGTLRMMPRMLANVRSQISVEPEIGKVEMRNGRGWMYWYDCKGVSKSDFVKTIANFARVTTQPLLFVFDSLNKIPLDSEFHPESDIDENSEAPMGLRIAMEKKAVITAFDNYANAAGGQHVFIFLAQASARMKGPRDRGFDWQVSGLPYAIKHMITVGVLTTAKIYSDENGVSTYTYRQERTRNQPPNPESFVMKAMPDAESGFVFNLAEEVAYYGKALGVFTNKDGETFTGNGAWYYKGTPIGRGQDSAATWLAENTPELQEAYETILALKGWKSV